MSKIENAYHKFLDENDMAHKSDTYNAFIAGILFATLTVIKSGDGEIVVCKDYN